MDAVLSFMEWFLKYFLPPMIANASPVLLRGGRPVDGERRFIDGKPLLGPGKTWQGVIIGVYMGTLSSLPISVYLESIIHMVNGFAASISALLGDMIGSFIKRRLGIPRGEPLPFLDQLDFALTASLYYWLVDPGFRRPDYLFYSLLLVLVLHITTNNVAYVLGVKDRRW